ncbi:MAG TPA: glycosyltransferase [Solirubrobacterales bacterium]|nr:glycosyltransferase [Solirubrobacterales bacterium]
MAVVTVGLAIIARDEEDALPRLLASVAGAFDQVALLDTGSEDRTREVFREWAERERPPMGAPLDRFEWRDDFGAARTRADSLLTTDWACYADADEEIIGAGSIRSLVATAPPDVAGISLAWDYVDGGLLYPVRVVRPDRARWVGRVHEIRQVDGAVGRIPPMVALVRHRRRSEEEWEAADRRNDLILKKWLEDEPDNERARWIASAPEVVGA